MLFLLFFILLLVVCIIIIISKKHNAKKSINSVLYCKHCGMAVPKGTEFCTKCGNKLESE